MPSMKTIKRRISTVTTTRQVMKAMDMVAAAKLKKTRERLNAARPLFEESQRIIQSVRESDVSSDSIFLRPCKKAEKNVIYLLITGDRGLCGSYNTNVSELALEHMQEGIHEQIIAIGLKGWEYFRRRRKKLIQRHVGMAETALFEDAAQIGEQMISMFSSGEVDEVYIAYTQFESSLTHIPAVVRILPIADSDEEGARANSKMRYDPSIHSFMEYAIPFYVTSLIYGALVESSTCEQAARMMSMSAASSNAEEIIDELTHMHNRIRQASITQEINEIISGANILS